MNPESNAVMAFDRTARSGARSYVHREARINEHHAGTSEIQRLAVARDETGLR
ncbi:hypothetical protein [Thermomonas sp.]